MLQAVTGTVGFHGLLLLYYLVALAAFVIWLFLPVKDTLSSLIASILGWISSVYVLFLTYGIIVFDPSLQRGGSLIPMFDIFGFVAILISLVWIIPLVAFFLFGRVLGRVTKRFARGY